MYKRIQLIRRKVRAIDHDVEEFVSQFKGLKDATRAAMTIWIGTNINPMYPGNDLYQLVVESTHADLRDLQKFNTHPRHREIAAQWLDKTSSECIADDHFTLVCIL